MAISLASIAKSHATRPPIVLIHGGPGVGKTTFAAGAENPVFIRTEDGLGALEVSTFPLIHSFAETLEALQVLYTEQHPHNWVVIDSLSALEPLIWQAVAKAEGKRNIEDLGYGKGYTIALDYWRQLFDALTALATDKGIGSLLIAHTDITRYEAPDVEAYDRAQIKLHKRAFQLAFERCDIIGYAAQRVFLRKDGDGFKERKIATGDGSRLLHLAEKPAFIAKNRYRLPETLPFAWPDFSAALSASLNPAATAAQPKE